MTLMLLQEAFILYDKWVSFRPGSCSRQEEKNIQSYCQQRGCNVSLKMAFFISSMASFQRGMQILKNWYGGQLDASLDSGSGTKSPLKILQVSDDYLMEAACQPLILLN